MGAKRMRLDSALRQQASVDPVTTELLDPPDGQPDNSSPRYETTERILRLLQLLTANQCTQQDIFERLRDYYNSDRDDNASKASSTRSAYRMLVRDINFLKKMGYDVQRMRGSDKATRYSIVKGSGPVIPLLFTQAELDVLVQLHTLFADPTKYAEMDTTQPLPAQPHNPFADDILALIERLVAVLPAEQKKYFDRWVRKPFVYFNLSPVTDYLPHRVTIEKIVLAISQRRQLRFEYASMQRQYGTILHEHVDPYYIIHQEGHLYLIGYNHSEFHSGMNRFLEYRIDRIDAESIKLQPDTINLVRRRKPIEFRYWVYGNMARGSLSQRWLSQVIEREEDYVEEGKRKHRVLVRATAYNEWRIIQQLHKYGDQVELVDPPELREKMRQEVERMYHLYSK